MAAKPAVLLNYPESMRLPYGPYMAAVEKLAHDGDTVDCAFSPGLKEYPVLPVRLRDVRAPELSEPGGVEARDFLRDLLPVGTPVQIETDSMLTSERFSFDRVVGAIILQDGRDVGALMRDYLGGDFGR